MASAEQSQGHIATKGQGHGLLGEKFTCLICGQEGLSEEQMRAHVLLEHVENNICCPFCDLSGITADEMNVHINSVHFNDFTNSGNKNVMNESGDLTKNVTRKDDPDKFGLEHGGAIPKTTTGKGLLKHSQSLDQSPKKSPSKKSSNMKTSHSESNLTRRGKLQLNFESVNEPGPSRMVRESTCPESLWSSLSSHSVRSSMSSHTIRESSSYDMIDSSNASVNDSEQNVRFRLQSSIQSQNDVIMEESQDNNNLPLQPNLNQVLQPDINDNVEPDINSNMPAGFSCPLCQFITSSENLIQAHVNMAHVDVLSPARPRPGAGHPMSSPSIRTTSDDTKTIDETTVTSTQNGNIDEYPCPICMRIFNNSGELSLHVNQEHSQIFSPDKPCRGLDEASAAGPSVYHCPVCEMEFYEKSRLEAHVNGHFSAEQTPIQERTDKLIAQALQEKETDLANHEEEKEFQKLQAMYGMGDGKPFKKAYETNLERAVANGDITVVEYHERKNGFKYANSQGRDDGSSCTKGVIQRLQEYYRTPTHGVSKSWLCTTIDHYAASYGDKGWGCGYRNFQMLLSALMTDPLYSKILLNHGRPQMPSIPKIQRLIETAWEKGFDKQGCDQLGGRVVNTVKWIGATEIVATLSSLSVKCKLLDFHNPSGPNGTHPKLFEWVKHYFEKTAAFKPPLYLQHQGHSRTIVGVEELKDKSIRLLIFDPSVRKKQMQLFHSIVNANLMRTLRKSLDNLKAKQYQIVAVVGILSEHEYKDHKTIQSERLS
ncbi:hypothetical protein ACF0H5_007978 [Mactra antiquata]